MIKSVVEPIFAAGRRWGAKTLRRLSLSNGCRAHPRKSCGRAPDRDQPRKRSASEALASSVSKRYCLSIRTHGNSRRLGADSSPRGVGAFSASSSLSRAVSHSSRVPVLCLAIAFTLSSLAHYSANHFSRSGAEHPYCTTLCCPTPCLGVSTEEPRVRRRGKCA